ncbi:MAG: hypothetical protein LUG93_14730 [Lachnospiraceae bacterium]|nr:hypothetical protein [Lachnospiraceae bacterium]
MEIDRKKLAELIEKSSPWQTKISSENEAARICGELRPELYPLLQAWMDEKPLPEINVGKYNIETIMGIQRSKSFLRALKLLNLYAQDLEKGEKAIWTPASRLRI